MSDETQNPKKLPRPLQTTTNGTCSHVLWSHAVTTSRPPPSASISRRPSLIGVRERQASGKRSSSVETRETRWPSSSSSSSSSSGSSLLACCVLPASAVSLQHRDSTVERGAVLAVCGPSVCFKLSSFGCVGSGRASSAPSAAGQSRRLWSSTRGRRKNGWQWQAEAEAEADKTISQSPTRQTFLRFCGWEIETKHPTKAQPCTHQDWDHIKTR